MSRRARWPLARRRLLPVLAAARIASGDTAGWRGYLKTDDAQAEGLSLLFDQVKRWDAEANAVPHNM